MPTKKKSFTELNDELEDVITRLQADGIDVDEALKLYEHGIKLTKELEAQLKRAENVVHELRAAE